jgi:ATP-dependent DNA helicase DinG
MARTLIDALRHMMAPASMKELMPNYEERPEQCQMAEEVLKAFLDGNIALIEAGTGTGKSLSYLLPSLLFALERGEQVIVATNTITLQEQLLYKDIPLALRLLNRDMHVVLAKGMGNYVCKEKVDRRAHERSFVLKPSEEENSLYSWCEATETGSRSDLPFKVGNECWDAIAADSETCTTCNCRFSSSCFFLAARRQLHDAHLILANHHLLFADLVKRMEAGNQDEICILPPLKRLVIDEAHHLEDVATAFFSKRSSRSEFVSLLSPFFSDSADKRGARLKTLFSGGRGQEDKRKRLSILEDLSSRARQLLITVDEVFQRIDAFAEQMFPFQSTGNDLSQKVRVKDFHLTLPLFDELKRTLIPIAEDRALALCSVWREGVSCLSEVKSAQKRSVKLELDLACHRLSNAVAALRQFFMTCADESVVHWLERDSKGETVLIQTPFDLSSSFQDHLFAPARSAILCSATLANGSNFNFCRSRFGLGGPQLGHQVQEVIYPSPFAYDKNALFGVPVDIPPPDTREYVEMLPRYCADLIESSAGGTLVLFTSYASMQMAYEKTKELLRTSAYSFFKQGDQSRRLTIDGFRAVNNAVLFATTSFWEGIDIPGPALRSVIIVKLPFDVPSDPIAEARVEALKKKGQNGFFMYSLPRACVRFKQAFGRLIRRKDDRGAVICLDTRLLTKPYGKVFLASLPPCPILKASTEDLMQSLKNFQLK